MTPDTLNEKFVYHLEEAYYVENQLLAVLDDLQADIANEEFQELVTHHREETLEHVDRLEFVFEAVGASPQERASPTFDALVEERESFHAASDGDDDMRDLHDLGIAVKNEHMEIAGYENLLMLARKLDLDRDVKQALKDNLDDEKHTKKQLKAVADDSMMRTIMARLAG